MSFTRRRFRNATFVLFALASVCALVWVQERNLASSAFTTGYLLLAAIVFLALYNVRKNLASLPLGSATAWLQWHLYVGIASAGVFALHVGPAWPNGWLEGALAAVFSLTFASGLLGLYLSRTIPRQLTRIGSEVIYERIPAMRRQVALQANQTVLENVTASGATTLADFYARRLYDFLQRPRRADYLLRPTSALRRALMREMQDLRRYFCEQEQAACERLFALVRRKDELDFHEARQKLLKLWLFAHIALTYVLLIMAAVHAIVAHVFDGSSL